MGSRQTLANPLLHIWLVHSSLFVEGNSEGIRNDKLSRSPDTLKITFSGSLVPSAATASAMVKLCFSAPQVLTGTVQLPVNSREHDEGSSNRISASSMLKMRDKGYPTHCLAAMMNWWNCTTFSSMSSGSRWASVVFARKLTKWRRFQFWYQPSEALNPGSLPCKFNNLFFMNSHSFRLPLCRTNTRPFWSLFPISVRRVMVYQEGSYSGHR